MEMANSEKSPIRVARKSDKGAIGRLLAQAPYCHIHVDGRLPGDWVGWPEFLLFEDPKKGRELVACLAATADPRPSAWVRIAATGRRQEPPDLFRTLVEAMVPALAKTGVDQLGWLLAQPWPHSWFADMGFEMTNAINTYVLSDLSIQPALNKQVTIRPVQLADMEKLAVIEQEAFEPLWRHSAEGLALALGPATSFEVALLDGEIVGFIYSVPGGYEPNQEHLARITVQPTVQGLGVGTTLLSAGLAGYRRRSVSRVSLNTQADNLASHRLYRRFGFKSLGDEIPVWTRQIVNPIPETGDIDATT